MTEAARNGSSPFVGSPAEFMKKVCFFHRPRLRIEDFHGYSLDCIDPLPYFPGATSGWRQRWVLHKLYEAKWVDRMYRERNPSYMRFVRDFVDEFKDADLLVMATYNPLHPEVLFKELAKPVKILGFIDEPSSTYLRGVPYLWAFDGAFYITPSFNEDFLFPDALRRWDCEQSYWFPQVPPRLGASGGVEWPLVAPREEALRRGDAFFCDRDLDIIYVGGFYDPKVDRLIRLRKRFGNKMQIHGRWPLAGYTGLARCLSGKPALWSRVTSLSNDNRTALYYRTKIGFNMHFSDLPRETGNMRMYEVPAHGMMLLCDKAGLNAHQQIFEPDREAVFYDSIEDAIDKIAYYLQHDEERERIARAGFARVHCDYDGETNLKRLLDWAIALPKRTRESSRIAVR